MSDDLFDALDQVKPKKKQSRSAKADALEEGLESVQPSGKVTDVTKRGKYAKHGNYLQVTFRIPPEYMDAIREIADEENISQASFKRWLVGIGLREYRKGRRPKVKEVVQSTVEIPDVEGDDE